MEPVLQQNIMAVGTCDREANYFMADMEQREPLPTPSHFPFIPFIQSRFQATGIVLFIYKMCIRNYGTLGSIMEGIQVYTHTHMNTHAHTHREREGGYDINTKRLFVGKKGR